MDPGFGLSLSAWRKSSSRWFKWRAAVINDLASWPMETEVQLSGGSPGRWLGANRLQALLVRWRRTIDDVPNGFGACKACASGPPRRRRDDALRHPGAAGDHRGLRRGLGHRGSQAAGAAVSADLAPEPRGLRLPAGGRALGGCGTQGCGGDPTQPCLASAQAAGRRVGWGVAGHLTGRLFAAACARPAGRGPLRERDRTRPGSARAGPLGAGGGGHPGRLGAVAGTAVRGPGRR